MIEFAQDTIFKLKKTKDESINKNAASLLIEGERLIGVYRTVRDQVVFTDKRIITIDIKGVTGTQEELIVLPYANILYFGVQTSGIFELVPDAELSLSFHNGVKAHFEFRGSSDIIEIGRNISKFALIK